MRSDILIAGIIIALCAFAVMKQIGADPFGREEVVPPLAMGEVLDVEFTLSDIDDNPKFRNVGEFFGPKATVLFSWSIKCPCVAKVHDRLRAIYTRFNRKHGVEWIALNGEPQETRLETRHEMARLRSFYRMLLDPKQKLCSRLGFRQATQFAVLDGEGRLVYRGALDEDYYEGKGELLAEALEAVVAGRPPPRPETPFVYGCPFDDPASCEEYRRLAKEREASSRTDDPEQAKGVQGAEGAAAGP